MAKHYGVLLRTDPRLHAANRLREAEDGVRQRFDLRHDLERRTVPGRGLLNRGMTRKGLLDVLTQLLLGREEVCPRRRLTGLALNRARSGESHAQGRDDDSKVPISHLSLVCTPVRGSPLSGSAGDRIPGGDQRVETARSKGTAHVRYNGQSRGKREDGGVR